MIRWLPSSWSEHLSLLICYPALSTSFSQPHSEITTVPSTPVMEVFMHNLPRDLTDQGLKTQLTPFIKALSIRDWSCQKPRKKTFGYITFLHPKDGEQFLRHHEEQPTPGLNFAANPRFKARLVILNTPVHCKRSNQDPDPFLLKSLAKSAEDRREAEKHSHQPQDAKVIFAAQSLSCGYYEYANHEIVYCPEVEWQTAGGLAKFANRALIIDFDSNGGKKRVEVPYRIIESIIVSTRPTALTLTLWEPPRLFHAQDQGVIEQMAALAIQQMTFKNQIPPRSRLTELTDGSSSHHEVLGQSLVYRISVSPVEFHEKTGRLHERDLLTISHHNFPELRSYRRRSLEDSLRDLNRTIREFAKSIPFSVLYQMEALVKNGFLLPWIVQGLLMKMVKLPQDNISSRVHGTPKDFPISAGAVKKLFSQIPFPSPEGDASAFEVDEIWQYLEENEKEIRQGLTKELISERGRQNLTMVHKVNITPTRMTLQGPDPEAKNRILRRFPHHTEYFIRVQFCDEDGTDLQFNSRVSNDQVYQRFEDVFKNGIAIGGRVYGFLGFSNSSLRSHAAWFMAPFVHEGELHTYFSVISNLGRFDNIFSPARCAARIGQAFSETPLAISLTANGIENDVVPDVKSKDGSRVFSDGVGTISQPVMEAIHAAMPQRKAAPTCFQIRWGGAKGMLGLDTRLEGKTMNVRPSMVKFQSTDNANLEICDTANKPIPMVLNRQIIKILEDMAVPDDWFFQQQAHALYSLQLITAHIANTVGFLKRQKIADHIGFPQLIRRLDSVGIDYKKDRFLRSVVESTVLRELRLLKHKARIPIDRGVTLFGIMDETGYLDEGEVYVTFDECVFISDRSMDLDNYRMIITRSPALHPGDIQLATNIIPPDSHPLRALKNCIVFSQKGKRDLPSCLSGGDLDGDIYGIIWDQHAVHGCQRIFEPADYTRVEPLNIGRVVERDDITDFFIQFMATDQLGLIAVRHMILADQRDAGTVDQGCKLLAQMHSTGVDYSKTGIPVDMTQLKGIKMSKYRPDFLAPAPPTNIKDRTEISFDEPISPSLNDDDDDDDDGGAGPKYLYYRSDKINGKLYRAIDEKTIWYQNIKTPVGHSAGVWDELLKYIKTECDSKLGGFHWAQAKQEAWGIRHAYEDAISNATLDFSDHAAVGITELEVFTGAIFNKSGVQTRRQRDTSLRLKDEFDRIAQWAEAMIRKRKMVALHNQNEEHATVNPNDALILSIACLNVGCMKEPSIASFGSGRSGSDFQSFKVIAACCAIRELDAAIRRTETAAGVSSLKRC